MVNVASTSYFREAIYSIEIRMYGLKLWYLQHILGVCRYCTNIFHACDYHIDDICIKFPNRSWHCFDLEVRKKTTTFYDHSKRKTIPVFVVGENGWDIR